MHHQSAEQAFHTLVALKYQLYNGLFLTLPFPSLGEIGIKLPVFAERCRESLERGSDPSEIMDSFFREIIGADCFKKQMEVLFLFVQLIERQVVLFDALEDAAYAQTRGLQTDGSLNYLLQRTADGEPHQQLNAALEHYRTRVVLTAHPTQFYPESVLGIIRELSQALESDDLLKIEQLLLQLGKTSLRNLTAPTPLSEANSLLDRARHVFYESILELEAQLDNALEGKRRSSPSIELGFWPGGDRDGNPHVTVAITLQVAEELRQCALSHYLEEVRHLKRRLTFPGMHEELDAIERRLGDYATPQELLADIDRLCLRIEEEHQGLFLDDAKRFRLAVETFGFHFASLDLRQDSSAHEEVTAALLQKLAPEMSWPQVCSDYLSLDAEEKIQLLEELCVATPPPAATLSLDNHPLAQDVIGSLSGAKGIQQRNGPKGLHRYIISNTQGAQHVLEVYLLAHLLGWDDLTLDIVPLFETVDDLQHARATMEVLYRSKAYRGHLKRRGDRQIVMVGFSDGTKDGGYLTCNWEIFRAKRELSDLSTEHGIDIVFFDGRGGPPARGGGNTHKFYSALGSCIHQSEVQLTIQGQTVSSNFGNVTSARTNIEQLFTAGLEPVVLPEEGTPLSSDDSQLLTQLSERSHDAYMELRKHPSFLPFMEEMTPLSYFGKLNVASRPGKRGQTEQLTLRDLRAIPFVGAWSQIKLNVPAFYGLGIALEWGLQEGKGPAIERLYSEKLFFRTLIDNTMQALAKSNASFTKHLLSHNTYGPFVKLIHDEAQRTRQAVLKISGHRQLLESDPINRNSIELRENLIQPLLVIQQYAMSLLRSTDTGKQRDVLEKLLLKTLPPITNASRNSA